jgi:hypothetical protein
MRRSASPMVVQVSCLSGFIMSHMMEAFMVRDRKLSVRIRKPKMLAVVEARSIFCARPLDTERGESKGVWIQRVSRELGITPSLGKKLYYRLVQRMDADTLTAMRENFNQLKERTAKREGMLHAIESGLSARRGDIAGGCEGAASAGRRGDGTSAGGVRAPGRANAVVSRS